MSRETESDFLGLVVHELRSPIAVIVGLAATLETRRHDLTDGQIDDSLRRIHAQGTQLAGLVDDLLDLAQVEAGQFRVGLGPVQLAAVSRRAVDEAQPPTDRSVALAVAEDLWVVADPTRLEQVLVNLLANAGRYGGRNVRLAATRRHDGVLVTVADDGPGVGGELAGRLFEKFSRETTDGHGAGLGLAIVRGLVEAFGGRVWYEPVQPNGACFAILLNEADARCENPRGCSGSAEVE